MGEAALAAGQSLSLETDLRPKLWRYYSPANAPRPDGLIELHVKARDGGPVSSALVRQVQVGDWLRLGPPLGHLSLVDSDRDLLLVGGEGHRVGRHDSTTARYDALRAWTEAWFPGAEETHSWSAQDYSSHDGLPAIGALPRGRGHVYVATGYGKWGLTNGVAAALSLTKQIHGHRATWQVPISRRITRPSGALEIARLNAVVGLHLVGDLAAAELRARRPPAEGEGVVSRRGVVPVGESRLDGRTCAVVALCTHLGGTLSWNDAEKSWDCPLHGSRFAAEGQVLEGPATDPLKATSSD